MEKIVQSAIEVEIGGATWMAEWCSFIIRDGSETSDRWLKIFRKEDDGTLTDIDNIFAKLSSEEDSQKRESILNGIAAARIQQIQDEYGIPSGDFDEMDVSEAILARVWAGEWMGQQHNSYYFMIDNLALIIGKDFLDASSIVETLNAQNKAGLNGFIIVPWKEEHDAFKSWEKTTGHKKLFVSDFSGWSCSHCGNHADELGPWANDVPCVPAKTGDTA